MIRTFIIDKFILFALAVIVLGSCTHQNSGTGITLDDGLNEEASVKDTSAMETISFSITINASPIQVHTAITDSTTFKEWASTFAPGSRFEGNWSTGSKMWFLSDDGNGGKMGMVSTIRENTLGNLILIKHLGFVNDGVESMLGPNGESVNGAIEQYTIIGAEENTELRINSDVFPEHKEFFGKTWPQALEKIKEISERTS